MKISSKLKGSTRRNIELVIMLLPVLIYLFVFSYIPMFGVTIAFKNYNFHDGILKSPWVGLSNFEFFFKSEDAWRITRNTVGLNFLFIIVGMFVAVGLALLMNTIRKRYLIKTYQTILILPHFLSWVIVSYMVYAILNPRMGILNQILSVFNADLRYYNFYANAGAWPIILLLVSIWKHAGMDLIIYYAGLMGIDNSYYEAAELDGASSFQKILHISIPAIMPLICIQFILKVGGIFRADFGMFYSIPMNSGLLYSTTDVIDTYVYRALKDLGDTGMSSAVGLFQSIVGLAVTLISNKIVSKLEPDNSLF